MPNSNQINNKIVSYESTNTGQASNIHKKQSILCDVYTEHVRHFIRNSGNRSTLKIYHNLNTDVVLLRKYWRSYRPWTNVVCYFDMKHSVFLNMVSVNLTLYSPCIILQYVYKPTRCTKFCDYTLFSITCCTCFGLYQSITRSNFYKLYIAFDICRYGTDVYKIRCTAHKVAPYDGLTQSETCRACNGK